MVLFLLILAVFLAVIVGIWAHAALYHAPVAQSEAFTWVGGLFMTAGILCPFISDAPLGRAILELFLPIAVLFCGGLALFMSSYEKYKKLTQGAG